VIIIGHLRDAPSPVPVLVDGREIPSNGRVVIRWMYPLPAEPPTLPDANTSPSASE
jgi:hypothetical protein